ncbi:LLM class flavin-dependent oxidoreductase [Agrococcus jejuensis]|uniref:FMN-dependent oxidoreductase, nitrilotriacetate monooxygenase family n=1 Tax=Agrococcus jejuensis TaxID=399736 RepID=A0A1G8ENP3_9MICO|nr:LLM class flavin-dependent oxidoreductase [Agrococcus jejuensis]SDH71523.1 FMN-dependent oxidoreductase, nitrilotriacetate monooxygenase family [Agrococcus jejuensis]
MTDRRRLRLGAVLVGTGGPGSHGAWKDPEIPGDASVDVRWYVEQARAAERARFDHVFIVDSQFITPDSPPHYLNRLEPLTLLSALAVATERIGLIGTLSTSYDEPFSVARRFASLDLISGGRAGWNVVTSGDEGTAGLFGRDQHLDYGQRYGRALEHVRLVQRLWDSYEDDAFPRDRERGVFLDPTRLHAVDHVGEHFRVHGPLNIQRSPQGQPVIFQAGDSDQGRDLGGAIGEGIFTHQGSIEAGRAFRDDLRARAVAHGRDPETVLVVPGISVVVGDTDEDARAIEAEIGRQDADFDRSLAQLGRPFGWYDFSQHDLDAPFPELGPLGDRSFKTNADAIKRLAREQGLTLRQVVETISAPKRSPFVGSAETVARIFTEWLDGGAVDGFNIHIRTPSQFARFADEVVPILQETGVFRREYEATTLRGNLGLPIPENRHAVARRAALAA